MTVYKATGPGRIDSPHLGDYATARQKRYISILLGKLHIKEKYEEAVMTQGEAGRLINRLTRDLARRTGRKPTK